MASVERTRGDRWRRAVPAVVAIILAAAALQALRVEWRTVSWPEILDTLMHRSWPRLAGALGLTALNYGVLTGYDFVALASAGARLRPARVMLTSFIAYAISNSVGFAMLSGASVRYRFYSRWGIGADTLPRLVFSYSVTFWLGLLALGGISLAGSTPLPVGMPVAGQRAAGVILAALPGLYLALSVLRRRPVQLGRFVLPLPTPALALAQLALSLADWLLIGAVLYLLLPESPLPFAVFTGCFLTAILLGMLSHVPGGLGVFEGLMVWLLRPYLGASDLLPALVLFRLVYYILPLTAAVVLLIVDEGRQRRAHVGRLAVAFGWTAERLTPQVLSVCAFLAGTVLLFSGATPAAPGRLAWLSHLLPLGLIEVSHFLGSMLGVALLILAQGLRRRLDAAFYLTTMAVAGGVVTSLLKGADYEEAVFLFVVLGGLWRARHRFDRRAAFFDTRFSVAWIACVAGAVAASIWLGLFAYQHVNYSRQLWWEFELQGEASRFLRASVGAVALIGLFAFSRLLRFAPHAPGLPTDAELEQADRIVRSQSATMPFLVHLRDKSLLFNAERSAFVMYAVQGRTWVALGDPVGPPECAMSLIRAFIERCHDFGGVPAFYEIGKAGLHRYADAGLTFVKLGEEARVDLAGFTLAGGQASRYRQILRRLEKDGCTFRIVWPADLPGIIAPLRAVSNDWLEHKAGAEKGFSLGFFDEEYLRHFPVAVISQGETIVAFANLWLSGDRQEISIDLMRYHRAAPASVMEGLFVHTMCWGRQQGYRRFMLGMAPLAGVETTRGGSLWNRLGALVFTHGESVYHFQGLRAYKEKFRPEWEPHYLAFPGGLSLPRVLADISVLVAGGYRAIFLR